MSHEKTWACIKPDGDGCDGDHTPKLPKWAEKYLEKHYPTDLTYAERKSAEYGIRLVLDRLEATKDKDLETIMTAALREQEDADYDLGRQSVREEVFGEDEVLSDE